MPKPVKVIDRLKLKNLVEQYASECASFSELCVKISKEFNCSWSCISQRIREYGILVSMPVGKKGAPKRPNNFNHLICAFRNAGIELVDMRQCFNDDPITVGIIKSFLEKTNND